VRALILAAGEGNRLRPLTLDCPKPMLPVGGRPILEHLVDLLRRHGIKEIAINLHYRAERIAEHFGNGRRFGVDITYSLEPQLLGSAGAARKLDWYFTEPFVVMYGDVLADVDVSALVDAHSVFGGLVTLALYEVEDPSRCGIVELGPDERIVRFVEKPAPGMIHGTLANAGLYVVDPAVLRFIPPGRPYDFGSDLFPMLLSEGLPLYGQRADGYLLDIGAPDRYAQAEQDWRIGRSRMQSTC
jgi:NDP-sugar pyrophosphorylase family protein